MKKIIAFCALFAVLVYGRVFPQEAAHPTDAALFPGAPVLGSHSAVVMDATTGTLVFYQNPDDEIPPASLTKLMTMHIAFQQVAEGKADMGTFLYPPRQSWAVNQPPRSTVMNLANGQRLTLRDLLLGLAIFSGNDAAVAVALLLSPSVEDFAGIMNREAASIGLERTHFVEPSGISEDNMTTAREFAEFCRFYLISHPESLKDFHSVPFFSYPRAENVLEAYRDELRIRTQYNRNMLIGNVEGVDGLKTGYIDESGYNIALTAERDGTRFICVILGAPAEYGGDRIRDEDGKNLLNWAFDNYKTVRPLEPKLEPVRVWKGNPMFTNLIPKEPLEFTASLDRAHTLYARTEIKEPLIAPLPAGSIVGQLVIYDHQGDLRRISLVTETEVPTGGFFRRLIDAIRLFFRRK